jgi:hypothetical protein
LLEGMPGRALNNQLLVMYNERVYQLTLHPVDPAYPQAAPDVNTLWAMAQETFTFLPQPVIERYSACPTGGLQGDQNSAPYLNINGGYCLTYPSYFLLQQDFEKNTTALTTNYILPGSESSQELQLTTLTLTIQSEVANGRTLAQVVDEVAAASSGSALSRTPATLGSAPAEIVEGFPDGSRHLYAVHDDKVYHLVLTLPQGEIESAAADAARLWEAVTTSFTFPIG